MSNTAIIAFLLPVFFEGGEFRRLFRAIPGWYMKTSRYLTLRCYVIIADCMLRFPVIHVTSPNSQRMHESGHSSVTLAPVYITYDDTVLVNARFTTPRDFPLF